VLRKYVEAFLTLGGTPSSERNCTNTTLRSVTIYSPFAGFRISILKTKEVLEISVGGRITFFQLLFLGKLQQPDGAWSG